ncbi:MAG: bifunctional pyr operon transcriptional regulator/uracil phosphoribosyltransferase PyrR [Candidatus Competibacter sp.]|nr:bifunctional pyr operon transcriptional regulator/uracil phosphoribosyltransferase PyrR [Candidatus Competibacter sp.]
MAGQLRDLLAERGVAEPVLVGIHTGGVWIAEYLRQRLGIAAPLGQLDISFYRDDFSRIGVNPRVRPSELPFDVDGRHLVLVDDVLNTGRTVRAALNELFDYGRPASVLLAVLVDRGGRELPIEANVVGTRLKLPEGQEVQLTGPAPLRLTIQTLS